MRIDQNDKLKIKIAVDEICKKFKLKWVEISLFGSRTKDHLKGGDLDLIILLEELADSNLRNIKAEFLLALYYQLGEQKIDLVIDWPNNINNKDFINHINKEKCILWTQ